MILKNTNIDISKIYDIVEKYKDLEGSLITILQETQSIYGYIPIDAIDYISEKTNIKPAKILGVATFYAQFRLNPVGKNIILLCQGTACHVNRSDKVYDAVCEELSIKDGETTEDGLFTLNNVACLGCCSLSPVMMINGETYGSLTKEKAVKIINEVKEGVRH
ncbi:MAG: NADH-quinone oxidoreductase subunit NuoE [Oscillospiraceae bacterium]|nr:NADH-quinone oxidoreductase subunit NuoE [Oscillospiraceae bacterium]